MTTLTHWEPMRELATMRDAMERLIDEPVFAPMQRWSRPLDEFRPAIDVIEEDGAYVIKASVPGMKPEDVEVTLTNNMVTLKGEIKDEQDLNEEHYHLRERHMGKFTRAMALPMTIDVDKAEATHENGILTLRIPKSETAQPKKIAVKAA